MTSLVRRPRAILTLGGTSVTPTLLEVELTKTASAGTLQGQVPLATLEAAGIGLDWLASQDSIGVSAGFAADTGDDPKTLFVGSVDTANVDFGAEGQVVTFHGRDNTANLTDTKNETKYVNQTSEEVAKDAAGQGGLSLDSDGGTGTAGKVYTGEQVKMPAGQSNWSLLRQLAESEGKDVCVVGNSVYFRKADDTSLPTYRVFYTPPTGSSPASSNATRITLSRNYQLAGGVEVKVSSWDYKKKQLVTSTATIGAGRLKYAYNYHQMTQDRADRHAKSKAAEHARHEYTLTVDMPGDPSLTPLHQIAMSTGSGADGNYAIDVVSHRISSAGYAMRITAKTAGGGA